MSKQEMRVGFVGLGIMGQPMAENLLKAGCRLKVYNRTTFKTEPLRNAGAVVAASPAEVAVESDIVMSCVSDSADVYQVVLDVKRGIIAGVDSQLHLPYAKHLPRAAAALHSLDTSSVALDIG